MNKLRTGTGLISLWRHFLDREQTVEQLTASMILWQEKWRWDFLKLNPPACYHALDWGAKYRFFDDPLMEPKLIEPVIHSAEDVKRLRAPGPSSGFLGEQLQVIRNLRRHFGPELPIVETIFSPIEIAHRLMKNRDALTAMRKESPDVLHDLLRMIADVFGRFAVACLDAGADGIFFATKWATSDQMSWEEYLQFGRAYEMGILDSLVRRDALIILHVCGERTFLSRMSDYPIDIFSYDFLADGAPDPAALARSTGKRVMGGIDPQRLCDDPASVVADCGKWRKEEWWIAGPSCVALPQTPDASIAAVREFVRGQGSGYVD